MTHKEEFIKKRKKIRKKDWLLLVSLQKINECIQSNQQQIFCLQQFMYDEYNTIANHEWIPKQAFLYFPTGSSTTRQQDDYKLIIKNQVKRLIYEGGIDYLEEEITKINLFKQYIKKQQVSLDKRWSKTYIYKFLQSTCYDYKKTLKEILAHNEYKARLHAQDFDELRKFAQPFLKQGPFYFNGRDAKFRPIIVCNIAKVYQMKLTEEQIEKCLQYFFQFMYRNMFIHGQVENVVGIMDLGYTSPTDLIKPMKMTINFLQGNYKYKLHEIYIIHPTGMFQFLYNLVKHLMKQDTIRKISIIEKNQPITKLHESANKCQFQEKFGGIHPNLKDGQYWPPKQFGDDFSNPLVKRNIISEQQYREMYKNGQLKKRKVYLDIVKDLINDQNQCIGINDAKSGEVSFKMSEVQSRKDKEKKEKQNGLSRAMKAMMRHCCFGADQVNPRKVTKKAVNE